MLNPTPDMELAFHRVYRGPALALRSSARQIEPEDGIQCLWLAILKLAKDGADLLRVSESRIWQEWSREAGPRSTPRFHATLPLDLRTGEPLRPLLRPPGPPTLADRLEALPGELRDRAIGALRVALTPRQVLGMSGRTQQVLKKTIGELELTAQKDEGGHRGE